MKRYDRAERIMQRSRPHLSLWLCVLAVPALGIGCAPEIPAGGESGDHGHAHADESDDDHGHAHADESDDDHGHAHADESDDDHGHAH
ncbi:MAG: hypothetical protein ACJAYU_004540, partial [Bradymonadia bacterium]